jgi:thiosulfate reductase cytochrome b subunit
MDIALEPLTYTVWVKGNMRQDELIHKHANAMNLLESCHIIVLILVNVMVSTDKDFPPIQTLHCFQMASGDYYVTKMIHCILRTNCLVPVVYHCLIHLLGGGERTKRTTILYGKLFPCVGVTKMGITD